jgi:hypothetical protein
MPNSGQLRTIVPMARTTSPTNRHIPATHRRRPSRGAGRAVQAAVVIGILAFAGARAMAAPVGPIDVPGPGTTGSVGSAVAADVSWGIDTQGRVDRVTVRRSASDAGTDQSVTVEVADETGAALATVTAVLHGPDSVVTLPTPVDPARVARVGVAR